MQESEKDSLMKLINEEAQRAASIFTGHVFSEATRQQFQTCLDPKTGIRPQLLALARENRDFAMALLQEKHPPLDIALLRAAKDCINEKDLSRIGLFAEPVEREFPVKACMENVEFLLDGKPVVIFDVLDTDSVSYDRSYLIVGENIHTPEAARKLVQRSNTEKGDRSTLRAKTSKGSALLNAYGILDDEQLQRKEAILSMGQSKSRINKAFLKTWDSLRDFTSSAEKIAENGVALAENLTGMILTAKYGFSKDHIAKILAEYSVTQRPVAIFKKKLTAWCASASYKASKEAYAAKKATGR